MNLLTMVLVLLLLCGAAIAVIIGKRLKVVHVSEFWKLLLGVVLIRAGTGLIEGVTSDLILSN